MHAAYSTRIYVFHYSLIILAIAMDKSRNEWPSTGKGLYLGTSRTTIYRRKRHADKTTDDVCGGVILYAELLQWRFCSHLPYYVPFVVK